MTGISISRYFALVGLMVLHASWGAEIRLAASNEVPAEHRGSSANAWKVSTIDLAVNDLIYHASRDTLYASVPGRAGPMFGNTIVAIDPQTGDLGVPILVGSEPDVLALADDDQYLYVSLAGAFAVRRVDLLSQLPDIQFSLGIDPFFGPYRAGDIDVQPGDSSVIAVALYRESVSPHHGGVAIFDDGVQRTNVTQDHTGATRIEFSDNPGVIYGYNDETSEFGFRTLVVDGSGVTETNVVRRIVSGFGTDIEFADGRIYATTGRTIDPTIPIPIGTYAGLPSTYGMSVDTDLGFVYFLTFDGVQIFDLETFVFLDRIDVPQLSGFPGSLVHTGPGRLAFRSSDDRVYFLKYDDDVFSSGFE